MTNADVGILESLGIASDLEAEAPRRCSSPVCISCVLPDVIQPHVTPDYFRTPRRRPGRPRYRPDGSEVL